MKLSVPFIPDKPYTDFLITATNHLESVYFSLHSGPVLDARMRFKTIDVYELSKKLLPFATLKKYCLLNSRFIHPDHYNDTAFINQTLDKLEILASHSNITGIVFSDAYFLNALSASKRDIVSKLEAVPGINCMLDSAQKAFSILEIIEHTRFKLPGKIIPDRALNRDLKQLGKICYEIKQRYDAIKIELLANEGCMVHCPFKPAHDAHISFSNLRITTDKTFSLNKTIGCYPYFLKNPEAFFKSPFIRPEDQDRYAGPADSIKLCGRTLGSTFLMHCINAYINKSHDGNLLNLMDATHWLSEAYHIENKKLDPHFFNQVTGCTNVCKKCSVCQDLFKKTASTVSLTIRPYKDYL